MESLREARLSLWKRWLRRPQNLWLRRAIFQVHLWSGMLLGIYVIVVCVSGSAIVFRNDIEDFLVSKTRVTVLGKKLSKDELKQAAERAYPNYTVGLITPGRFSTDATEVRLVRGWMEKRRVFDPYTGKDLGPSAAGLFRLLHWMGDIHGNLLMGPKGLVANGIGGLLVALLCLTGMIVWWPGSANWRRSLGIHRGVGWKRFNWDLHSASGFWLFAILFMWGITGAYFPFPDPFRAVVNHFTPIDPPRQQRPAIARQPSGGPPGPGTAARPAAASPFGFRRRPQTRGQKILRGFSIAHYGIFGGWPVKALWVLLGLAPAILFVTGFIMWWNRVLRPAARRLLSSSSRETLELVAEGGSHVEKLVS